MPSSGQNINCTWAGIIHYGLYFAFQRRWYKKIYKIMFFFCLCIIFYQICCVIFSYIPFTFPYTSKCFRLNGTKNMYILASGPELLAVRFGYAILGENWRKGGGSSIGSLTLFVYYMIPYVLFHSFDVFTIILQCRKQWKKNKGKPLNE